MEKSSKAVIYVRVSSKEQEREGFSIPAQKKLLTEYALANGLSIVKVFEESESAKIAGRANFKNMIQYLKEHRTVTHILVEKTDRLYRNLKDYNIFDPTDWPHINIHLVKENEILSQDSRSHQKFIHGIKVLMAKNYSDNLSEEVRKGMTEKASQGLYPTCAPIGYINNRSNHTIEPDPKAAPFIKRAFDLASTGQYSLSNLADVLFKEGMRSTRAKSKLGKSQIDAQLATLRNSNTAYIDQGVKLMELARQAPTLFLSMTNDEKRELVNLVLSNPQIINGSLRYDLKKPFSMFANVTDLVKWRGGRDSNSRPSA